MIVMYYIAMGHYIRLDPNKMRKEGLTVTEKSAEILSVRREYGALFSVRQAAAHTIDLKPTAGDKALCALPSAVCGFRPVRGRRKKRTKLFWEE